MKDDFFLTPEQLALLSAALRHVRDAERLLADSPDQTYHLAGFGPECARKAVLDFRWADKAIGHSLTLETERLVDFLAALDPRAQHYLPKLPTTLKGWQPQVRYNKTGTTSPDSAEELLAQARESTQGLLVTLWADGRIDSSFLLNEEL